MRSAIIIFLTTLFVSAMPLQAAYATADDAPVKEACSTPYETVMTPEVLSTVAAAGGRVVELKGEHAVAFLHRVEQLVNQDAPFTVDLVAIVRPSSDTEDNLNIAYFKDGCLKSIGHMPAALLIQIAPEI